MDNFEEIPFRPILHSMIRSTGKISLYGHKLICDCHLVWLLVGSTGRLGIPNTRQLLRNCTFAHFARELLSPLERLLHEDLIFNIQMEQWPQLCQQFQQLRQRNRLPVPVRSLRATDAASKYLRSLHGYSFHCDSLNRLYTIRRLSSFISNQLCGVIDVP